jgi:succinyl-CoA synthetase alpha subunit
MSILIDQHTRLLVQGITGRDGGFHTQQMVDYGTKVVAGVTPGRGGEKVHGVPVFDDVASAVAATRANTSVIYVPASGAADAIFEAADAGLALIVCITEGIPVRDAMAAYHHVAALRAANGNGRPRLIGPNCPGLISPGHSKVGILPGQICTPGPVGLVSRSGTLTYEVVHQLTQAGLGQSTCIGIGGDPVIGTNFVDALELFEADPHTEAIVLIGEAAATRRRRPSSSAAGCTSRWCRSSPARPHPRASAWATPGRSSRAAAGRRPRRWPPSRRPACRWPASPRRSRR